MTYQQTRYDDPIRQWREFVTACAELHGGDRSRGFRDAYRRRPDLCERAKEAGIARAAMRRS